VLDQFLDWLAQLPTVPLYVVLLLLSALENVFPPVPADVAVALGAFLAQRGKLSLIPLGIACWLANVVSAAAMYELGRKKGAVFFATGWPSRLLPPAAIAALQAAYAKHGMLGIFVSRFLPGVRAAVTPFAGIAGLPPWKAMLPTCVASAIWYSLLVAAGAALGLSWPAIRRLVDQTSAVLGAVGLLAVVLFLIWLIRVIKKD